MEGEFLEVKNRRRSAAMPAPPRQDRTRAKTRMCIYFEKNGKCRNGDHCPYAHSSEEIVAPQCHYGAACRFKDRCRFSHPAPQSPPATTVIQAPIFSSVEFPPMPVVETDADPAMPARCFRDACAVVEGEKTLTLGGDAQSLARAVDEIRAAFSARPDTVFNLCFSRPPQ